MLRTLGVVQALFAREGCRPHARRKLAGKSILEWIVRRVTDCQRLDGVIVLTDDAPENAFVAQQVPLDVPVLMAHRESDGLNRYESVLEEYPAEGLVRVSCDYPFLDPTLVDRLISDAEAHPGCDYVTYCARDGRPAILSSVGLYAEWFRASAVRRAARKATTDREDISRHLYSHPEKFCLRMIPAPVEIDRDDLSCSLESDEDWERTLTMLEALGPEELDWQRIADLLDQQPSLRCHMTALRRTHARS